MSGRSDAGEPVEVNAGVGDVWHSVSYHWHGMRWEEIQSSEVKLMK